jgi:anti-anti-sigma factor
VETLFLDINEARQVADNLLDRFDAVVLDLRSCFALGSGVLSRIVAIDKYLRKRAKHCILIASRASSLMVRMAQLHDILIIVSNGEKAIEYLYQRGPRVLSVTENTADRRLRRAEVSGDLSNDTAALLADKLEPILAKKSPLILDLTNLASMDCGGLQHLMDLWSDVRGRGELIHCVTTNSSFVRILSESGLSKRFVIHSTADRGLTAIPALEQSQRAFEPSTMRAAEHGKRA